MSEIFELAKNIKAVVLDVDGVFTQDTEYLLPGGGIAKVRSHYDGQGISLMRAIDLRVVFITSESDKSTGCEFIKRLVDKWNDLPSSRNINNPNGWFPVELFTGVDMSKDKGDLFQKWLLEKKLRAEDCVVMGDDLVDVPMLRMAGFKTAPAQAEKTIIEMVDWVTPRHGGGGAVRDLANLILEARQIDPLCLPPR